MKTHDHAHNRSHSGAHHATSGDGAEGLHGPGGHAHHSTQDFKTRLIVSLLLTAPILALSTSGHSFVDFRISLPFQTPILFALSTVIYVYGGFPFLQGWVQELRRLQPGMMTLIGLAISVAYVYSAAVVFGLVGQYFFWELATLIDIMLLGHWIELKSVHGASRALEKLAALLPATAHIIDERGVHDAPTSEIQKGARLLVRAGEKIPADGVVRQGVAWIDESLLTGEAKPVERKPGDAVIAGSINGDSVIEIEARGSGQESYLNRVVTLVAQAQAARSRTQQLADRAASWLTLIAIVAGVLTLIYWIVNDAGLAFAIERMATVMVVACPHALGLAIPLVNAVSTAQAARNGLLIRNRTAFEEARKVTILVFDKTGTLTEGRFGVSSVQSFSADFDELRILAIAAALEINSEHLIGRAIVQHVRKLGLAIPPAEDFRVLKGEGVKGRVEGKRAAVVSESYLRLRGLVLPAHQAAQETTAWILIDDRPVGRIELADPVRPESPAAIRELRAAGVACWMLTGDNQAAADRVSDQVGLDGALAEVLPHEKLEKIAEFQKGGAFVAMVGDGINDAPALAQANVGIAIGAGADVAAETADIILVNSDPRDVPALLRFGRATYAKMRQNLFWATAYNVVAIPLAAGALESQGLLLSPAAGAALMSLSTIIVAFNARLLRLRRT